MKKIINIVEDEKDLNELVKSYLEKEGYLVNSFLTFDAAYAHIDDDCDLWILDIMLDDKSGSRQRSLYCGSTTSSAEYTRKMTGSRSTTMRSTRTREVCSKAMNRSN